MEAPRRPRRRASRPIPRSPTTRRSESTRRIVKQIGRHLVVLQDGRLFSADLGTGAGAPLRLADRIDVYRSPQNAASWYDEMLVQGD